MGFLEKAGKIANSIYTILILVFLIGSGAYALSKSVEIGIISIGLTLLIIWLKILTDDVTKIKKKLKMRDE